MSWDRIEYFSAPAPVSMGDRWFEIADAGHFWIQRRFQVFRRLAEIDPRWKWGEVGCGHGILQREMEREFDISVDGIELNTYALERNVSERSRLIYYNVFDRHPALRHCYDRILLFDVIEHLADDEAFLKAVLHMLTPGGALIVNVPAFMHLYSKYDAAAGHVRRYGVRRIRKLAADCQLTLCRWTYWGWPLTPLLAARKVRLALLPATDVIAAGFAVSKSWLNRALVLWSQLEIIPQHFYGTSLMAVLTKPAAAAG